MRREEQPLIHAARRAERCTALETDAGCGKTVAAEVDRLAGARDISAALGNSAAEILYQRADENICLRLGLLGKFAVAVVDEYVSIGACANKVDELVYLRER